MLARIAGMHPETLRRIEQRRNDSCAKMVDATNVPGCSIEDLVR
jgi:hypothetical protein